MNRSRVLRCNDILNQGKLDNIVETPAKLNCNGIVINREIALMRMLPETVCPVRRWGLQDRRLQQGLTNPSGVNEMSEQRSDVIVFLAGMGTRLTPHDATAVSGGRIPDFWGADKLVPNLAGSNLSARFLVFSYRGIDTTANGGFEPAPYTPTDTLNRHLWTYVERLHDQLHAFARQNPDSDFHLVGHSEGGLIAFSYLTLQIIKPRWQLPHGGRIASVVTLDAPLGGVEPMGLLRSTAIRLYLAVAHQWHAFTSFNDLVNLLRKGDSGYPLGASASVMQLMQESADETPMSNQELAEFAREHDVRILTIGNARDYCFAPGHGVAPFISTQWLADEGKNSGTYGRWVALGQHGSSFATLEANHGAVLTDPSVQSGIISFLDGNEPVPLLPSPSEESLLLWCQSDLCDARRQPASLTKVHV